MKTEIVAREMPAVIPLAQATCLYRVLQEGLQNVKKHAKAANVLVRLLSARNGVELCIQDDGCGLTNRRQPHTQKGWA
ncbi:MAG: hypothetical protein HC938_14970 [Nitrospira sp.]|nr:hypothetical protein [Nitrospira sp.]